MCLKIDKTLIGTGFTTGDVPTARVRTYAVKTQNCPQMSVRTGPPPHTHTHTHTHHITQRNTLSLAFRLSGRT